MGSPLDSNKHKEHNAKEVHSQPNLAQAIWSGIVNECQSDMDAGMKLIPGNRAIKEAVAGLAPLTIFAAGVGDRHGAEVYNALKQNAPKALAQAAKEGVGMAFPQLLPIIQVDPRELHGAAKSGAASTAAKAAEAGALSGAAAAGLAGGLAAGSAGHELMKAVEKAAAVGVHHAGKEAKTGELNSSSAKKHLHEVPPATEQHKH